MDSDAASPPAFAPPPRTESSGSAPAAPAASAPGSGAQQPSTKVLDRWNRDIDVMHRSICLMLQNQVAEADNILEEAAKEVETRDIDFSQGDHDLRGCFAFVGALMGLVNGLASLENDQFDTVLRRVWAADELLVADGDWAGKTVLRGLCLLVGGLVEIFQGSMSRGIWHILKSWTFLRYLESEALHFEGHEQACVRSTALLALGVFNLCASMLPPTAMKTATWLTGFTGGRDLALTQLRKCWREGGIQAPFAGLALVGFSLDVSSFLGELQAERAPRLAEAQEILEWAKEKYPGAFFFEGLDAYSIAVKRDLRGSTLKLTQVLDTIKELPAFRFLVFVRQASFSMARFRWEDAGEAFFEAASVYRAVKRRALCPTLLLNAHLCFAAAGNEKKATEMLDMCRSYRHEKKTWSSLDRMSLGQAEQAHRAANGEAVSEATASFDDGLFCSQWRPMLLVYLKICAVHRAVEFMSDEDAQAFLGMLREEAAKCDDDADSKCMCLALQAEAARQMEAWEIANSIGREGVDMLPSLSDAGVKSGAPHLCLLACAYAHHGLKSPGKAKDALASLSCLPADHFFQKTVEFKATHLRKLVGAEIKSTFTEVFVPARGRRRVLVRIPDGVPAVEWEWLLKEKTINCTVLLNEEGEESRGTTRNVQSVDQHSAEMGPCTGSAECNGAGTLEFQFDNSFSVLTGKKVHLRVEPRTLEIEVAEGG